MSLTSTVFSAPSVLTKTDKAQITLTPTQQKKQDDARALVSQLEQIKKSLVSDRKGQAKQKLDQAKEKLRILRSLGGDPKQVARQAAQIAREIRAAAQEYASALRDSGGGGGSVIAATPVVSTDPAGSVEVTPSDAAPTATPEEARKAYQEEASAVQVSSTEARAERENLREFRDAAQDAKRLIDEATRKLKAKKPGDNDAREAEVAGRQLQDSIVDLGKVVADYLTPVASNDSTAPVTAVETPSVSLLV